MALYFEQYVYIIFVAKKNLHMGRGENLYYFLTLKDFLNYHFDN